MFPQSLLERSTHPTSPSPTPSTASRASCSECRLHQRLQEHGGIPLCLPSGHLNPDTRLPSAVHRLNGPPADNLHIRGSALRLWQAIEAFGVPEPFEQGYAMKGQGLRMRLVV